MRRFLRPELVSRVLESQEQIGNLATDTERLLRIAASQLPVRNVMEGTGGSGGSVPSEDSEDDSSQEQLTALSPFDLDGWFLN